MSKPYGRKVPKCTAISQTQIARGRARRQRRGGEVIRARLSPPVGLHGRERPPSASLGRPICRPESPSAPQPGGERSKPQMRDTGQKRKGHRHAVGQVRGARGGKVERKCSRHLGTGGGGGGESIGWGHGAGGRAREEGVGEERGVGGREGRTGIKLYRTRLSGSVTSCRSPPPLLLPALLPTRLLPLSPPSEAESGVSVSTCASPQIFTLVYSAISLWIDSWSLSSTAHSTCVSKAAP